MSLSVSRAVAVLLLLWPGAWAGAQEHRYDAFARTIAPFVGLFAPDTRQKALRLELELLEATGLDTRFHGLRALVGLEMPDRLRMTVITRDDRVMLCRNGQRVWAFPGEPVREVVAVVAPGLLESKGPDDMKLRDFTLPVPSKQLVFLPALFKVTDAGEETVEGQECRVLDVALMPELAGSLGAGGWSARLWTNDQRVPVRLRISRGETRVLVAFRAVGFAESLPEATWAVPAQGEVVELNAAQVQRLVEALLGAFK